MTSYKIQFIAWIARTTKHSNQNLVRTSKIHIFSICVSVCAIRYTVGLKKSLFHQSCPSNFISYFGRGHLHLIGEVGSFCYLGSKIRVDGGADVDVQSRIGKAPGSLEMLKNIWLSIQISKNLKLRTFKSNVLSSVLSYGCDLEDNWRYNVFANKCLRRIHMIRWPNVISNE